MNGTAIRVVATLLAVVGWGSRADAQVSFPHETHEGLFPTCAGCHAGITTGEEERHFPPASTCNACHNGRVAPQVAWEGPQPSPSNLRFTHASHPGVAGGMVECRTCHQLPERTEGMAVGRANQQNCRACHTAEHLVTESPCQQCHVPLSEAQSLAPRDIMLFPIPPTHGVEDFLPEHGPAVEVAEARCTTCHVQESCARCHVNWASLPAIQALGRDARVADMMRGRAPRYPTPESHSQADWITVHGWEAAENAMQCSTCHARPSCTTCHGGATELPGAILQLPTPDAPATQGVQTRRRAPTGHVADFVSRHGGSAAAEQPNCSVCHSQNYCATCHDGPTGGSYHADNFMARHGPEAFGRANDCASCHNTEAFCRDCHVSNGISSEAGRGAAFHDAEPYWLIGHGQAARQELESCVSCHQQSDCMRCHSALTGGGISPHGPDFDGSRLSDANPTTCRLCHGTQPVRRE